MKALDLSKPSHPPTALKTLVQVLLVGMSVACQRSELDTAEVIAAPKPALVETEPTVSERSEAPRKVAIEPTSEIEPTPKIPLNLKLSPVITTHSDQLDDVSFGDQEKLPDLFDGGKKRNRTSASARLLRDEENPDLIKSVDGLEVNIERKF